MPMNNEKTGSIEATILLQKALSCYMENGEDPFIMFMMPCSEAGYTEGVGSSWEDELAFTPDEVDKALSTIGTKIPRPDTKRGKSRLEKARGKTDVTGLIIYWINGNRETAYMVNLPLYCALGLSGINTWTQK